MLGELALHDENLTAPAQSTTPAHRVDIDTERAGSGEQRCPERKAPALARRGKNDEGVS